MENPISSLLRMKRGDSMFGYSCQECGRGIVKPTVIKHYKTKFSGYPFVVPEAAIGICDVCGAKHFSAEERKRWRKLFEESLESHGQLLKPQEIVDLRKQLGLSIKDFALLIGTTLQPLSHWELEDRQSPQSRTTDLLMRLIKKSLDEGKVDVLDFLSKQANYLLEEL